MVFIGLNVLLYLRVSTFISMFVEQYIAVIGLLIFFVSGGFAFVSQTSFNLNWILLFNYLNTISIVTGESAILSEMPNLNDYGTIVLLV
ncbi:hypothetical protein ACTQ54_05900 [Fundicoccus sp. Sow4_H7]|uniref:hypothetical protein n=1 Tax=Fundicoccus sp. Sow4_H7 TaxID=3438784 RepID=UPI003F91AC91